MAKGDGYDALYRAVGARIAGARAAQRMKQGQLAAAVGVTRTSIVNIEHGRQRAPLHLLWQLAAVLDVELARLIPRPEDLVSTHSQQDLDPLLTSIVQAAQEDPAAQRLLADFVRQAKATITSSQAILTRHAES